VKDKGVVSMVTQIFLVWRDKIFLCNNYVEFATMSATIFTVTAAG